MLHKRLKKKTSEDGSGSQDQTPPENVTDAASEGKKDTRPSEPSRLEILSVPGRSVGVKDPSKEGWDRFEVGKTIDFQVLSICY